ncbi:MAG: copper resistance CopC/CopD family protein [Actinomycetota bacterium]
MRRSVRIGVVGLLTVVGLALGAGPALAHAGLESSDPADGSVLDTPPDQVLLTFSEPPDLTLSTLGMLDATGAEVQMHDPEVVPGEGSRQVALTPMAALGEGVYTVTFRVVSRTDGHLTAGSIAFGVGQVTGEVVPAASAPTEDPWPSALSVIGKTLLYGGLILIFGAAVVGMGAFAGEVPGRRVLLPLAGVTALVGAGLMLVAEARSVGAGIGTIAKSDAGEPFLRLIIVCVVVAVVATIAGFRGGGLWLAGAGEAAAFAMLVRATGGHAGGRPLQVVLQWIHFMVVAVWVGGFTLLLLLLRARRRSSPPVAEAHAYSSLAGYALVVVVVSGVGRAIDELDGWSGITKALDTPYGTTLVIKVAIVIALIGLGTLNRFRAIPHLYEGSPLLGRLVGVEVVTALAIFGATATLTGLPPHPRPARPAQAAAPASVTVEGSDFATTVHVTLTVTPGAPGPNGYEAHVVDFDSGEPVAADAVSLRFEAVGRADLEASQVDLMLDPDGHWMGDGTELSVPGPWTVTALITTGAEATEVPMSLSIEPVDQQMNVATDPGQPTIVTFTMSDGMQLQYYADPGVTGTNQLHLTAFDANGLELPLETATIVVTPSDGSPELLDATRFSPGHFVANTTLEAGDWHIDLVATTKDGASLTGAYDQTIG